MTWRWRQEAPHGLVISGSDDMIYAGQVVEVTCQSEPDGSVLIIATLKLEANMGFADAGAARMDGWKVPDKEN